MTKTNILDGITTLATATLPATGECTADQKAEFSNQLIDYLQKTVNPDKTAKPSVRF